MKCSVIYFILTGLIVACPLASAQTQKAWELGAVLDTGMTSRALALGGRDGGLQLGHSDLTARGPLGEHLNARLGAVFATHEGKLERTLEEAWIETRSLPYGMQVHVGRFASQIGYLNTQHPHADDFAERPLLYRAFFGGHWNDDGLRLNWTAPTPFYVLLGIEALRGKRLVAEAANPVGALGVGTLALKTGADWGRSHSWQLGLSYIHNRRTAVETEDAEESTEHEHTAQLTGRKTYMLDLTWKWAPSGNNREQQVRIGFEAARMTGVGADPNGKHEANFLTAVWRFRPDWEVGARADWLRSRIQHDGHFDNILLREGTVMLAYKPSHRQSVRLQYSMQGDAVGVVAPAERSLMLQYVLAFGVHNAHSY